MRSMSKCHRYSAQHSAELYLSSVASGSETACFVHEDRSISFGSFRLFPVVYHHVAIYWQLSPEKSSDRRPRPIGINWHGEKWNQVTPT
jgi:hypothetical protein